MCGIIGYIGNQSAAPILLKGLKNLEYRGYDSAGIAIITDKKHVEVYKKAGKVLNLASIVPENLSGTAGIGHTRWATHGGISDLNAHPHQVEALSVIHNGIIENFQELKDDLIEKGYKFKSETDTEVFANLAVDAWKQAPDLPTAIRMAFRRIEGTATIVILNEKNPDEIIAIKRGTPLVAATNGKESLVASDPLALTSFSNMIYRLSDNQMVIIKRGSLKVYDLSGKELQLTPDKVENISGDITKGEYPHFMVKEMYEQELALVNTLTPHLIRDPLSLYASELEPLRESLSKINKIYAVACGTGYHACLSFKYLAEKYLRIPVEIDYASEFRYRKPVVNNKTMFLALSQSGETADTLAAMEEAKSLGAICICICNVRSSSMVKTAHATLFTNAGPEICVCSTKAFTSQLMVNAILTYTLGNYIGRPLQKTYIERLMTVPSHVSLVMSRHQEIKEIAKAFYQKKTFMFIGRGFQFPLALEGALKLKEIAYVHAEGHASGELKHGHIALIDKDVCLIGLAPKDSYYEKTISNIIEVKSRGASVLSIGHANDERLKKVSDYFIGVPEVYEDFQNIINVIPLQLFAYEIALLLGREIDQPRNLAKSVTVE